MVNPDIDSYTKTLNHRKMLRKTQKKQQRAENQKKRKSRSGGPVFTFSSPWGAIRPSAPRQLRHCSQITG